MFSTHLNLNNFLFYITSNFTPIHVYPRLNLKRQDLLLPENQPDKPRLWFTLIELSFTSVMSLKNGKIEGGIVLVPLCISRIHVTMQGKKFPHVHITGNFSFCLARTTGNEVLGNEVLANGLTHSSQLGN